MGVEVHQVGPHIARPDRAQDRVHVGPVEVEQGSAIMKQPGDLADLGIEQPEGVGVGDHEDGGVVVELGLEVVQVDESFRVALDRDGLEARELRRGGIGAVRAVGDENLGSTLLLSLVAVVRGRDEQGGQFPLRAGGGLEADRGETADLGQHSLKIEQDRQQSLKR